VRVYPKKYQISRVGNFEKNVIFKSVLIWIKKKASVFKLKSPAHSTVNSQSSAGNIRNNQNFYRLFFEGI